VSVHPPALDGVEHRWVSAGDVSLHVAEAGSGPPLVLVHGWPQHWWAWRRVIPLLAPHARLVMPDLRGLGWSEVPRDGYAKERFADDILALLDALGLERVGLVGHDWGGWTGWLLCARAAERLTGYLSLDTPHPFAPTVLSPGRLARMVYQPVLATPVVGEAIIRRRGVVGAMIRAGSARRDAFTAADLDLYEAPLREPERARASSLIYRTFLTRELVPVARGRYRDARVDLPVRAIFGARSPVLPDDPGAGLRERAPRAEVEVVPGCGHFVAEEEPELVAERARELFGLR
jgi:pimeloyl-ACP methyl ester carboxylesterase